MSIDIQKYIHNEKMIASLQDQNSVVRESLDKMFFNYEAKVKSLDEIKKNTPREVWPFRDELTHEIVLCFSFYFPYKQSNNVKSISFTSYSKYHEEKNPSLKLEEFIVRVDSHICSDEYLFLLNNYEHITCDKQTFNLINKKFKDVPNSLLGKFPSLNTQVFPLTDFSFMDMLHHARDKIIDSAFQVDIPQSLSSLPIQRKDIQEFHGLFEDCMARFLSSIEEQASVDTMVMSSGVTLEILESLMHLESQHKVYKLNKILKPKTKLTKSKI